MMKGGLARWLGDDEEVYVKHDKIVKSFGTS
jgi:hypothetical protein